MKATPSLLSPVRWSTVLCFSAALLAMSEGSEAGEVQTQIVLEPLPLAVKENYYARKLSPQVLTDEKGRPQMLYLAIWDADHKLNANIAVPLRPEVE